MLRFTIIYKNISISTLPQLLSLLILEQNGQQTLGEIAGRLGCSVDTVITDIHGLVYNPNFNPQGDPNKGIIVGTFNAQTKEFKELMRKRKLQKQKENLIEDMNLEGKF